MVHVLTRRFGITLLGLFVISSIFLVGVLLNNNHGGVSDDSVSDWVAPYPVPPVDLAREEAIRVLSEIVPWFRDPIPLHEDSEILWFGHITLLEVYEKDPDLGRMLAQAPWVVDGINLHESQTALALIALFDYDSALARRMLAYSLDDPVRSYSVSMVRILGETAMAEEGKEVLDVLVRQDWFVDGLSAEEQVFTIALIGVAGVQELFNDLLQSYSIYSEDIFLPLAGDVTLWMINHKPFLRSERDDILATMGQGVRGSERLVGAPFPFTDVIMLTVNAWEYDELGNRGTTANLGDYMVVGMGKYSLEEGRIRDRTLKHNIYHEINHFYLSGDIGPAWLFEGLAEFTANSYIKSRFTDGIVSGAIPLNPSASLKYCREHDKIPNIVTLFNLDREHQNLFLACLYPFAEELIHSLFNVMGEAAFSSAVRELHTLDLYDQNFFSDEEVYAIFLKHVPPGKREEFVDTFRLLWGSSF